MTIVTFISITCITSALHFCNPSTYTFYPKTWDLINPSNEKNAIQTSSACWTPCSLDGGGGGWPSMNSPVTSKPCPSISSCSLGYALNSSPLAFPSPTLSTKPRYLSPLKVDIQSPRQGQPCWTPTREHPKRRSVRLLGLDLRMQSKNAALCVCLVLRRVARGCVLTVRLAQIHG